MESVVFEREYKSWNGVPDRILYKRWPVPFIVKKPPKSRFAKVYCPKCDLVFDSREKFDRHLPGHSSLVGCEACPIDTAIAKLISLFKRNSGSNLE